MGLARSPQYGPRWFANRTAPVLPEQRRRGRPAAPGEATVVKGLDSVSGEPAHAVEGCCEPVLQRVTQAALGIPTTKVAGIRIADLNRRDLLAATADLVGVRSDRGPARTVYAAHVTALRRRHDAHWRTLMERADLVYADGASVVACARSNGGVSVERYPTTDFGGDLVEATSRRLRRPIRTALIGGPPGLAEAAAPSLEARGATIVYTCHGYRPEWDSTFEGLQRSQPEIIFVGLGSPREQYFVDFNRNRFPRDCLVLTCGGWFGFLSGAESRAPEWMQHAGLEWAYRLKQSPARLWRRYAVGSVDCAVVIADQFVRRQLKRSQSHSFSTKSLGG